MNDLISIDMNKSPEQLAKEDLVRQTLEEAASRLETRAGNEIYTKAWRAAAKFIRSLKLP